MSGISTKSVIFILFCFFQKILNKTFPDVSINENLCFKDMQKSIYKCTCEPYDKEYIKNKPSYVKFAVSYRYVFRIGKSINNKHVMVR